MSEPLKPDSSAIREHLAAIKGQAWLKASQKWWPDHLFHFTDLTNAVNILAGGALLSRSELEKTGTLPVDIASPQVISGTAPEWKDYVRLYFRPRTPTQFRNEGFRPVNKRELGGAHCPMPIVFIFDAERILTQRNTRFSDGNLAANAQVGDTGEFLASLPFEKIYHDESLWNFSEGTKRNIIVHRHAEVIVPQALDLSALKWIWCRSQAEFETFLFSLPKRVRQQWERKIGAGSKPRLFFARWSFVEKADLSSQRIMLSFNPSETPGPFHAKLEVTETRTKTTYIWEDHKFYAQNSRNFDLGNLKHPKRYQASFWLDECIAYRNEYLDDTSLTF